MDTNLALVAKLIQVMDRLLAPDGCPWDREQTVATLTPMLLEEASEAFDALHEKDEDHLLDELGDLIVTFLMLCKKAQNENRFCWDSPFAKGAEKLIRRHPHIFAEKEDLSSEEVVLRWDEVKKTETFHSSRKSCIDGIPESLPIVARLQKLSSRLRKSSSKLHQEALQLLDTPSCNKEEDEGRKIAKLIFVANVNGINLESSLRGVYSHLLQRLRQLEP